MDNLEEIDAALAVGAAKASAVANEVIGRVRQKTGY
jgi:tryptophanyl-tRNA synthetase